MEEDVLDMYLNSSDVPFANKEEEKPKETKEFKSKGSGGDLWNETSFVKKRPDPANFEKAGKTFTFVLGGTPDEESKKLILGLIKNLAGRGFILRYQFNNTIDFYKTVTDIEGLSVEAYRPWKKMAPDLASVAKTFADKQAYEAACYYAPKFSSFPPGVRCIRANAVYALLGKEIKNPSNFILCWTECGSEAITKDTDFKKIGNAGVFFTMGKDLNIPIYNIKNKDSVQKLAEYLKNL